MPGEKPVRIHLTASAEQAVQSGHPWVFDGGILKQNRQGQPGELAALYGKHDRLVALGLYDPDSPFRVRVFHRGGSVILNDRWWQEHLLQPIQKRQNWFDCETTGYRLIHGESDGWPGLVLDRYGSVLVLKLYTAAWLPWLKRLSTWIRGLLTPESLVLRLSRNIQSMAVARGFPDDGTVLLGKAIQRAVPFLENGLQFEAEVCRGQKTGFFLDQRENRQRVATLAAGKHVLNLFSYSGGFSVYAARGGALSATDVDVSAPALESARRHFQLNAGLYPHRDCRHSTVQADAFEWLQSASASARYDLVVLDPPSLTRQASNREAAMRAYRWLVQKSLRKLRLGGILVAASCSAHVRPDEFFNLVRATARVAGMQIRDLATTGQPVDHPATFREAEYLKCIYLQLLGATHKPKRRRA